MIDVVITRVSQRIMEENGGDWVALRAPGKKRNAEMSDIIRYELS